MSREQGKRRTEVHCAGREGVKESREQGLEYTGGACKVFRQCEYTEHWATEGRKDRRMEGWKDAPTLRVASSHLKAMF